MSKRRPVLFKIATRILLLNVLIVFLPVVSMLLLTTYEGQLLEALERSLVQQGRLLAAALSVSPELGASEAEEILAALRGRHEARLRVLDADGNLLADSSTLPPRDTQSETEAAIASREEADSNDPRESPLYRIASFPVRLLRGFAGRPETPLASADFYTRAPFASGSEIQDALAGRYGAATRVSAGGQISVTLYSALPIERGGDVAGAVLVSQSTYRILQDLYQIRLDVFTIFLWCLAAAIVLSIFLSLTIARPLSVLQRRAREAVDERGRLRGPLPRPRRRDEIGALSHSLAELTEQIDTYTRRLEGFAADASHELKNPLASIAASCEMALAARDDGRRVQFLTRARCDVRRAESIITGMRELSQIDARTDRPGSCRIGDALVDAVADLRRRHPEHTIELDDSAATGVEIPLPADRFYQVVSNLVSNAASFSPVGSSITLTLSPGVRRGDRSRRPAVLELSVLDEGQGFEEIDRVFDRFYSSRAERDGHLGLGLSIVKAIVESIGGTVTATNRDDGRPGARVVLTLPTRSSS